MLYWLMNIDFAGGGAVAAAAEVSQHFNRQTSHRGHRRRHWYTSILIVLITEAIR